MKEVLEKCRYCNAPLKLEITLSSNHKNFFMSTRLFRSESFFDMIKKNRLRRHDAAQPVYMYRSEVSFT